MLILSRKIGEVLHIGDNITVSILEMKGNQVRLGIDAPKDVAVHREEIYEKIKTQAGLMKSEMLTASEKEQLRRRAKEASAYVRKVFKSSPADTAKDEE